MSPMHAPSQECTKNRTIKTKIKPKTNEIGLSFTCHFASLFIEETKLKSLIHSNMGSYNESGSKTEQNEPKNKLKFNVYK
jgi:hypothetical protein